MSKDQQEPPTGVLRVSGAATLVAPCDVASFVVTLRSSASTFGRASAALKRRRAKFDKLVIAHAQVVTSAQQQPHWDDAAGEDVTVTARIQLKCPNTSDLADLLDDIRKLGDTDISPIVWSLAAENRVFAFVRKAATEDAIASAKEHARTLKAELGTLAWLANDEAPTRLDDNEMNAVVRAEVLAQFFLGPVDLSGD
jgi:uncharacterized protein YggE